MGIAVAVFSVMLLLACISHLFVDALGLKMIRTMPILERLAPVAPERWPRVSVIITACNEAETLHDAATSKLAEDYPDFELIIVDDRSTDGTGTIVDELAAADPRVRPLHVRELPAGWLGKVNAMQRGLEVASGEWILFSDADVFMTRGAIRRAIALCDERGYDFLAVVPQLPGRSFLLDVLLTAFWRSSAPGYQSKAIEDRHSRASAGTGAFNLVRRSALERTDGLVWQRLEVDDDEVLAQQVKRAGGRTAVASGRGMVTVAWYRSVGEMALGVERTAFGAIGAYRLPRHLALCAFLLFSAASPFLAAAGLGWDWLRGAGAATAVLDIATAIAINGWARRSYLPALLHALGDFLFVVLFVRSGMRAVLRGGILWRGTLYSLDDLRRGRRFQA